MNAGKNVFELICTKVSPLTGHICSKSCYSQSLCITQHVLITWNSSETRFPVLQVKLITQTIILPITQVICTYSICFSAVNQVFANTIEKRFVLSDMMIIKQLGKGAYGVVQLVSTKELSG